MTEQVLASTDKAPLESKKYVAFLVSLGVLTAISGFGMWRGVGSDVLETVLTYVTVATLGYIGSTAGMEAVVRRAAARNGAGGDSE